MDDAFLVRVLNRLAHLDEQLEPLPCGEIVLVAIRGDAHSAHQLHHKVGPAGVGRSGVQDFRDVWVVHHRERLALGLEARDYALRVHAQLDHFQRDTATHRLLLLRHPHDTAAAFADFLEQLVATDDGARRAIDLTRWRRMNGRLMRVFR